MEEFKADNSEMLHDDTFDLKQFEKEVRQEIAEMRKEDHEKAD